MRTVYGLFDNYDDANHIVDTLLQEGYTEDDISILTHEGSVSRTQQEMDATDGAAQGAKGGAALGGLAGLLVGIGAITLPGVGPILAAGPILAMLTSTIAGAGLGAATGGIIGALVDWGVSESTANIYAEGIKRGGVLLAVNTREANVDELKRMFDNHNARDVYAFKHMAQAERVR